MMNRLNQILGIVLIIQIGLAAYLFLGTQATAQENVGPLIPDFSSEEVTRLTIEDGDEAQLVLARNDEQWVLPEADDFPADGTKIDPLLEKIGQAQTNRLVTRTEGSHKRLQVTEDDFNRLLTLELSNGEEYQLYLGSSAGVAASHIRLSGQDEVYLTGEINSFDLEVQPSAWIDPLYFEAPVDEVTALILENEQGTFEFEKEEDSWIMEGLTEDEVFDEATFTNFLNQATSVRMTEPIGLEEKDSFGLGKPRAVLALQIANEEEGTTEIRELRIGAKDDGDNNYVISSSESDYFVHISEPTGNNFVEKTHEDFLVTEEEEGTIPPQGEEFTLPNPE